MDSATSAFERTPHSQRLHIALFGRRNVGKSSLVNALTGQHISLVSDVPGTTTDPVTKAIELHPLGPCVLVDTAGWDDVGALGELRSQRTRQVVAEADLALVVTDALDNPDDEAQWVAHLAAQHVPTLVVLNKADTLSDPDQAAAQLADRLNVPVVAVSATSGIGIDQLRAQLTRLAPDQQPPSLTAGLAAPGDTVVLVMPQDPQAPKGRLILPQVQTLRDLLDKRCRAVCCLPADLTRTLADLRETPQLVITDSQVFADVYRDVAGACPVTSFSVLMSAVKGDLDYFVSSAAAIDSLTPQSRVLIAEACSHAPLSEDIGREQIPRMLRQRVGDGLQVDVVAGHDFPDDLTPYHLIIHCGGCMITPRLMRSRVRLAQQQGVPLTNYGITIAHLRGILPHIALPHPDR